jgi:hypothetical protein
VPATDWVPAVGTGSIEAGTITADEINAGSVSTAILVADAIKAGMIDASAVTAREIAAGTITADKITAGTITATQIASSTITGSLIASSTITGANIAGGTISGANISGGTITGTNLASATVDGANLKNFIIDAVKLAEGNINITGSAGGNRTLSIRNVSGVEQVAVGNISGRTGVPSGDRYGMWGTLGTNVYIRGTQRLITNGFFRKAASFTSVSVGSTRGINTTHQLLGSTTIRSNTQYIVVVSVSQVVGGVSDSAIVVPMSYYLTPYSVSGGTRTNLNPDPSAFTNTSGQLIVPAGSYSEISTDVNLLTYLVSGGPDFSISITGNFWIYEEIL